jgi:hypothetical protein
MNVRLHIIEYRHLRIVKLIFPFGRDISAEGNQSTQHIPEGPEILSNVWAATQSRAPTGHCKEKERGRKELNTQE